MSLVDSRRFHMPGTSLPTRKPVPQIIQPQSQPAAEQFDSQRRPFQQTQPSAAHSRSRTASSSIFPPSEAQMQQTNVPPLMNPAHAQYQASLIQPAAMARRTPSNATTSTMSSTQNPNIPMRQNSGSSLQRSTSSRSGGSPTSYVALMRKQKATVWSDRAQLEDPRQIKQQQFARARAAAEINNANNARGSTSASTSSLTGGVRSKIRHHGAPKAREYIQSGLPTSGVPMRLSQNEIDEGDDDDTTHTGPGYGMHARTDSGRSSVGSGGRLQSMYGMPQTGQASAHAMASNSSTPPSGPASGGSPAEERLQPEDPTPVPDDFRGQDYFASASGPRPSGQSGSSGSTEREDSFGQAGKLPLRARNQEEELEAKKMEAELRRRGSVDERTMTMSGLGRLFIANPDA